MKKFSYLLLTLFLFVSCQKEVAQNKLADEQATKNPNTEKGLAEQPGGKPFIIMLTGAQEAPGPGDPDGAGVAELYLNQGQGTISYKITTSDIAETTGAHIHKAPAGSPGPIVVHLSAVANGTVSGVAYADKELIKEIRKNPSAFYVNVHSVEYRPGAIRGQLSD